MHLTRQTTDEGSCFLQSSTIENFTLSVLQ